MRKDTKVDEKRDWQQSFFFFRDFWSDSRSNDWKWRLHCVCLSAQVIGYYSWPWKIVQHSVQVTEIIFLTESGTDNTTTSTWMSLFITLMLLAPTAAAAAAAIHSVFNKMAKISIINIPFLCNSIRQRLLSVSNFGRGNMTRQRRTHINTHRHLWAENRFCMKKGTLQKVTFLNHRGTRYN